MFFSRSKSSAKATPTALARESAPLLGLRGAGVSPAARVALAEAHFHDGNLAATLDELAASLAENPELAQGQLLKGIVLARSGQFQSAIAPLRLAIELGEETRHAHVVLAATYLKMKDYESALVAADALVARSDVTASDLALRGEILRCLRRTDEAISALRGAVDRDPEAAWIREKLGVLLGEHGRFAEGLAELDAAVRLAPASSSALAATGDLLTKAGRGTEALQYYRRAALTGAPSGAIYGKLGHCCVEQGLLLDAVVWLRTAIGLDPHQPTCLQDLARIYTLQGRPEFAERYLKSAEQLAAKLSA